MYRMFFIRKKGNYDFLMIVDDFLNKCAQTFIIFVPRIQYLFESIGGFAHGRNNDNQFFGGMRFKNC